MGSVPAASSGNVVLTGYIDVPMPRRSVVWSALPRHVELTRSEAGCLHFEVTEDPLIEGRLNVHEIFTNRNAFEAHQKRTAGSPWAEITAGLTRHYNVEDVG